MPVHGWDAVTVPGAVSAWVALSERYGKLPFADLFSAAIRYARDGFMVSPITAMSWARQAPNFTKFSEFAWTFLPKDRAPPDAEGRARARPDGRAVDGDARGARRVRGGDAADRHSDGHSPGQPVGLDLESLSDFTASGLAGS